MLLLGSACSTYSPILGDELAFWESGNGHVTIIECQSPTTLCIRQYQTQSGIQTINFELTSEYLLAGLHTSPSGEIWLSRCSTASAQHKNVDVFCHLQVDDLIAEVKGKLVNREDSRHKCLKSGTIRVAFLGQSSSNLSPLSYRGPLPESWNTYKDVHLELSILNLLERRPILCNGDLVVWQGSDPSLLFICGLKVSMDRHSFNYIIRNMEWGKGDSRPVCMTTVKRLDLLVFLGESGRHLYSIQGWNSQIEELARVGIPGRPLEINATQLVIRMDSHLVKSGTSSSDFFLLDLASSPNPTICVIEPETSCINLLTPVFNTNNNTLSSLTHLSLDLNFPISRVHLVQGGNDPFLYLLQGQGSTIFRMNTLFGLQNVPYSESFGLSFSALLFNVSVNGRFILVQSQERGTLFLLDSQSDSSFSVNYLDAKIELELVNFKLKSQQGTLTASRQKEFELDGQLKRLNDLVEFVKGEGVCGDNGEDSALRQLFRQSIRLSGGASVIGKDSFQLNIHFGSPSSSLLEELNFLRAFHNRLIEKWDLSLQLESNGIGQTHHRLDYKKLLSSSSSFISVPIASSLILSQSSNHPMPIKVLMFLVPRGNEILAGIPVFEGSLDLLDFLHPHFDDEDDNSLDDSGEDEFFKDQIVNCRKEEESNIDFKCKLTSLTSLFPLTHISSDKQVTSLRNDQVHIKIKPVDQLNKKVSVILYRLYALVLPAHWNPTATLLSIRAMLYKRIASIDSFDKDDIGSNERLRSYWKSCCLISHKTSTHTLDKHQVNEIIDRTTTTHP